MAKRKAPDIPCRQIIRVPFNGARWVETRSSDGDNLVKVEGVASVFDYQYEVYGGPANYGWYERVAKGAFDATLKEDPDVVFLANHEGLPLARTTSGTLQLSSGKTGLDMVAELDRRDTEVNNLIVKMERGDVNEMSFAFRVTKQTWEAHPDYPDDEMSLRTIQEVNLNRGDVSAVTYGASDATAISIARSLQLADDAELEEMQALIAERLNRSHAAHDGMSEREEVGGMPAALVQMLRITPNPTLQEYFRC